MIYASGALVVTILFKIATSVKEELGDSQALPCGCSTEDDDCDCGSVAETEEAPAAEAAEATA
jgi:molybdopterin-containing oxidoreductase family membrane subunit